MKTEKHRYIQLATAVFLILIGCGLLIAGFIVTPIGEIHSSVLIAFGEILTFAGTLLGIDYRYKYKYNSNDNNSSTQGEPRT